MRKSLPLAFPPSPSNGIWSPGLPEPAFLGIRSPPGTPVPCYVVSDSWPGWLSILPSFAFICTHLYVHQPEAAWLPSLLPAHPGCQVFPLPSSPSSFPSLPFGFLQGSSALLPYLTRSDTHVIFSLDWPCLPPVGVGGSVVALTHDAYGGVVLGQWTFWSTHSLALTLPATVEERTLFHLVDSSRKVSLFQPVAPPPSFAPVRELRWTDDTHSVLEGCGLLPIECPHVMVRSPLNFSPTRWAIRQLTNKELLGIFDWSESLLMAFPEGVGLPFLQSAPGRLLGAILDTVQHPSKPKIKPLQGTRPTSISSDRVTWPKLPEAEWHGVSESTTTADNTEVPIELWNDRVMKAFPHAQDQARGFEECRGANPLDVLRSFFVRVWRRRILRGLLQYLSTPRDPLGKEREKEVGRECLGKAAAATWWEWSNGSTPFFWRWPLHARTLVRDGHPPFFLSPPPRNVKPQRSEPDEGIRQQILQKIQKVIQKGYIAKGEVISLTSYFAVPKGTDDVRLVYDATASGLNACLWAPNFWLPSADSLVDAMSEDSWMGDLDMGEQFLNFPMHPSLQVYCGIDLRPLLNPCSRTTIWRRWTRCMMGLRPSPYFSGLGTCMAEELVLGDRFDPNNPMQWETVALNLPGAEDYDPKRAWVTLRTREGLLAATLKRYVDDMRSVGHSEAHCWAVTHRVATMFSYLGLQIALRKLRPLAQHPGPWAGTIAFSCKAGVGVTCPEGKWTKAKGLLQALHKELATGCPLQRKPLESMRGFFVHLMQTFPIITPYLKGLHLTLDGWRPNRDDDMWKLPEDQWTDPPDSAPTEAPTELLPASRLMDDIQC